MEEDIKKRKDWIKDKLFGWVKGNYDKVFIAVLIIAFILRFIIFLKTMNQPVWQDAANYLATAKNWGLGLNLNDIWYYRRGFFWPVFSAFFFKIRLGEIAIRFTEVLFATGTVAISYFLIKDMFNKKLALLTSIGVTFSWIMLFFVGRPMNSIPASFFLLLSLLFFWKGYELKQGNKFLYLFAVFYAIACLTRMQYLMFAPIFLIYFFIKEKFKFFKNKQLWICLGIFLLMLLPFFISYGNHYGNPLVDIGQYYFKIGGTASTSEAGAVEPFLPKLDDYFRDLPYILSKSVFVAFLIGVFCFFINLFLGFDKIFKNKNIQKKFFVFLWIVIPFLILSYMAADSYIEQRYIMPTLPFLFLIVSAGVLKIVTFVFKQLKLNKKFLIFALCLVMVVLLVSNILWANELIESKKSSYLEVKQAGLWLKENSNPEDMIISRSQPQLVYYAERNIDGLWGNESFFEEGLKELEPRYLVLSMFEPHPPWLLQYPQIHNETWVPVKVYPSPEGQPLLIIYENQDWNRVE